MRGRVRFDGGARAPYATDASNHRQVPIGVVELLDADDIEAAVSVCRRHGAPVLPRGGGTSLAGQCCNVAVVLDTAAQMHRVLAIDIGAGRAPVQPGTVLDTLRDAAERHGLTLPSGSGDTQSLHAGRHDREQLLRRALRHGRQDGRQRRGARSAHYDGQRMRVAATSDAELARLASSGARRDDLYAALSA